MKNYSWKKIKYLKILKTFWEKFLTFLENFKKFDELMRKSIKFVFLKIFLSFQIVQVSDNNCYFFWESDSYCMNDLIWSNFSISGCFCPNDNCHSVSEDKSSNIVNFSRGQELKIVIKY